MYVLPFHVTLSMSKPFSVSFQTMPDTFTAVPGSQGPRLSGSVMVAASGWPPEVLPPNPPATGEATEAGEADSSLSTLPLEQSPLSCKRNKKSCYRKIIMRFFLKYIQIAALVPPSYWLLLSDTTLLMRVYWRVKGIIPVIFIKSLNTELMHRLYENQINHPLPRPSPRP